MNDLAKDDKLISSPPRDYILNLRRDALMKAENEKLRLKTDAARDKCDSLLRGFADSFFFDSKVYGTLKPKEKNELAEIYASYCRKSLILKSLPFAGIAGIVTGLGILNPITLIISFFSILVLFALIPVLFIGSGWWEDFICGFWYNFQNSWQFLSARKFLKKALGTEVLKT